VNGLQQVGPVPTYGTAPTYNATPMGIPYTHVPTGPIVAPPQQPMHGANLMAAGMLSPPNTGIPILGDLNNNGYNNTHHISPHSVASATVTSLTFQGQTVSNNNGAFIKSKMTTPPDSPGAKMMETRSNVSILSSSGDCSSLSLNSSGGSLESSGSTVNLSIPIDFSFGKRDDLRRRSEGVSVQKVEPLRFLPTKESEKNSSESKDSMWRPW